MTMKAMALVAALVCAWLMAGCERKTLEACEQEATKRPTVVGVNTALRACRDKFAEERRKSASAQSERVASQWAKATQQKTIGDASGIIGAPDTASAIPCEKIEGEETAPEHCTLHAWTDRREPRVCVRKPSRNIWGLDDAGGDHCEWRMITDRNGKVRGWWPEPS